MNIKCKNIFIVLLLHTCLLLLSEDLIFANNLPVIHRVGVIPATFENEKTPGLEDLKSNFSRIVLELVYESKRFEVLNDGLVKEMWETPAGRRELETDFELDSFVHFIILPKHDHIIALARLLDKNLSIQLQESETIERAALVDKPYDELKESLRPLMFRLFTRLPIDVSVTSVQGRFITISGGEDQALSVGDSLKLLRASVKTLHPAHGGWSEFDKVELGSAIIVETKKNVSVAEITFQVKEGAIKIGDGATIEGLSTRRLFVGEQEVTQIASNETKGILIPPKAKKDHSNFPVEKTTLKDQIGSSNNIMPEKSVKKHKMKGDSFSQDNRKMDDARQDDNYESENTSVDSNISQTKRSIFEMIHSESNNESIDLIPRYRSWSINGPVTASAKFSLLPVNEIKATLLRSLNSQVKYKVGILAGFGQADTTSNYFSYGVTGSGYWVTQFQEKFLIFNRYKLGVRSEIHGRSLPKGIYGGQDYLTIGFFSGLSGEQKIGTKRFHVNAEFSFTPMTFGRVGYNGSQHPASSSNGWEISGAIIERKIRRVLAWGGGVKFGSIKVVSDDNDQLTTKQLILEAIARWKF